MIYKPHYNQATLILKQKVISIFWSTFWSLQITFNFLLTYLVYANDLRYEFHNETHTIMVMSFAFDPDLLVM